LQNFVVFAGSLPHFVHALASGAFVLAPHSPQKFTAMDIGIGYGSHAYNKLLNRPEEG
jgi:hypothetical protein